LTPLGIVPLNRFLPRNNVFKEENVETAGKMPMI